VCLVQKRRRICHMAYTQKLYKEICPGGWRRLLEKRCDTVFEIVL